MRSSIPPPEAFATGVWLIPWREHGHLWRHGNGRPCAAVIRDLVASFRRKARRRMQPTPAGEWIEVRSWSGVGAVYALPAVKEYP